MTAADVQNTIFGTGFYVRTNSPGDGKTYYRFFVHDGRLLSYFEGDGVFACCGAKEAYAFASGVRTVLELHPTIVG